MHRSRHFVSFCRIKFGAKSGVFLASPARSEVAETNFAQNRDWSPIRKSPGRRLGAHCENPTIPVFVVRVVAAHPQASQGAGCGQTSA